MNEFKKLKKISNRLKKDFQIPSDMRLKYLMLDVELDVIGEDKSKLNESLKMYKNTGSPLYKSIWRELRTLKYRMK